jgi:hypothetical protein
MSRGATVKNVQNVQAEIAKIIRDMSDRGLRIGQIMSNVFDVIAKDGQDPFFVTDVKLLEYLNKYFKS